MAESFKVFERGIDHVAQRFPEMPREEVILTRLYFFVFRRLNDRLNRVLAEHNLNTTTMLALVMIYARPEGKINPSDLSLSMISSKTNITRLADDLVRQGWVSRKACAQDRRKIFLSLTDEGRSLVEQILPIQWEQIRDIWAPFSPDEQTLFEALLRKLLAGNDE